MGFFLKVKSGFGREAATISLKRCTSIDVNIKNSSITASPAVKVTVGLEPFPDPDTPTELPCLSRGHIRRQTMIYRSWIWSSLWQEHLRRTHAATPRTGRLHTARTRYWESDPPYVAIWVLVSARDGRSSTRWCGANKLLKTELATYHVISNHCISSMSIVIISVFKITISMYANSGTFTSLLLLTWQLWVHCPDQINKQISVKNCCMWWLSVTLVPLKTWSEDSKDVPSVFLE